MAYDDLRRFLDDLDADGDLVRVSAQVDPELEVAEIVSRTVAEGGPALLFENVKGSSMPLAIWSASIVAASTAANSAQSSGVSTVTPAACSRSIAVSSEARAGAVRSGHPAVRSSASRAGFRPAEYRRNRGARWKG